MAASGAEPKKPRHGMRKLGGSSRTIRGAGRIVKPGGQETDMTIPQGGETFSFPALGVGGVFG